MRVITGTARGRRLVSREGREVRPTSERVKEGMFSAIQFDIEGRRVLDLFAGSGQLGIEALSRGAASCAFVDASAESVDIVQRNIKTCGFEKNAQVVRADYAMWLKSCAQTFDILFLDPPFGKGLHVPAIEAAARVLSRAAVIVCEHPADLTLPPASGGFSPVKNYRYGRTAVTLLRRAQKEDAE